MLLNIRANINIIRSPISTGNITNKYPDPTGRGSGSDAANKEVAPAGGLNVKYENENKLNTVLFQKSS